MGYSPRGRKESDTTEHLLSLAFTCFHLTSKDAEHLFMCLLAICIIGEILIYFVHFKIGLFVFLLLNCKNSL